jgi:putative hydroxymethylpyrimidine transport system substrate-binding protein
MKLKKAIALLLSLALILGALTACGGQTSEPDSDLREINVVLDWYPNALHAFLYTAIERGYFAEEGLKVNIQFPSNANDALSLVAAGKAEIGMYYPHDIIQAVAEQDIHVKSIGAVVQSPLCVILALSDQNIHTPADLVGKTVGYGGTALSEAFVRTMMESVGADTSNLEMVDVGFDLMSSMTTGNVDATIGCLVNHEVPQLEEEGFEVDYFMATGYGIPNYYEEVFLASDDMIENEPDVLRGFLRAAAKGFADFKSDPAACLQILLDNQNEENFPLTPSVEEQSVATLLPLMETADAAFLSQDEANWQENIDWMLTSGLISHPISVSDVMADLDF